MTTHEELLFRLKKTVLAADFPNLHYRGGEEVYVGDRVYPYGNPHRTGRIASIDNQKVCFVRDGVEPRDRWVNPANFVLMRRAGER